jgi:hypothetical protein
VSLNLALADAANNCDREGATAIITLKSGVQYEGKLDREKLDTGTAHMTLTHGGWVTIDKDEIAAVEAKPQEHF